MPVMTRPTPTSRRDQRKPISLNRKLRRDKTYRSNRRAVTFLKDADRPSGIGNVCDRGRTIFQKVETIQEGTPARNEQNQENFETSQTSFEGWECGLGSVGAVSTMFAVELYIAELYRVRQYCAVSKL